MTAPRRIRSTIARTTGTEPSLAEVAAEWLKRVEVEAVVAAADDPDCGLLDWVQKVTPWFDRFDHLAPYAAILEGAIGSACREVIAAPPQHGKTELLLHAFAFYAARHPGLEHAYITYNQVRSQEVAIKFIEIATRAGLEVTGTRSTVRLGGGTIIRFTSIDGSLTGAPITGLCAVDDPLKNSKEAFSAARRATCEREFQSVAYSRRHRKTSYVVMATRWHIDDLSGILVKRGWRFTNLKAIAEGATNDNGQVIDDPIGRRPGEALWSRKPPEFFEEERKNAYFWAAMYQGSPRPIGGTVFGEPTFYSELPTEYSGAFGIDLAYTAKTSADWSVCVEGLRSGDTYYVRHVDMAQCQAPLFAVRLRLAHLKHPHFPMLWRASGTERGAAQFVSQKVPVLQVQNPPGDKFVSAQEFAALWNSGKVLVPDEDAFPESKAWLHRYLESVLNFTGVGDEFDDPVDATGNMIEALKRAKVAESEDNTIDDDALVAMSLSR
jgi:phage terminase large subunit-like protein